MKKECIAMLLAGGQGSRLYVLTENMAKPAVPFGGKFRIIDFPLSNCANAGIDTVGVLTQYRPLELNRYIGSGQPWDLDRADGGVHILPPYQSAGGASWYKGTANAIFQNIGFVDMYDPEYVLILSGDHIYKMNYAKMLAHHKKAGADCTISVMEVPWEDAPRFGIMNVDENDTITEFEEKPAHPKSNLASMGIYVFTWKKLRQYLIEDGGVPFLRLLEGRRHARLSLGCEHGYARDRQRARSSRKGLADLWPLRLRAAGVLRRQRARGAQRRRARLHGRGGGGELRPL